MFNRSDFVSDDHSAVFVGDTHLLIPAHTRFLYEVGNINMFYARALCEARKFVPTEKAQRDLTEKGGIV